MTKLREESADLSFLVIARRPSVVKRAVRIAVVVGFVLAIINHGNMLISGQISWEIVCKIFVTFCVPYCVSTYSSVLAVRESASG